MSDRLGIRAVALLAAVVLPAVPCLHSATTGETASLPDSSLSTRVEAFVTQIFTEGVPYEEAHQFGPEALPILQRFLAREDYKRYWPGIVMTVGYINAPGSFKTLRSFLDERFQGEVDLDTFNSLLNVLSVLGFVKGPEATEYLAAGVNPANWKEIRWHFGHNKGPELQLVLSKVSINGLSYTGTQRATEVLARLKAKPYSKRQVSNIDEGVLRNAEIASKGLGEYFRRTRERYGR